MTINAMMKNRFCVIQVDGAFSWGWCPFDPNGVCQIKSYEGPQFRYGRGYIPEEQHVCFDRNFRDELDNQLGANWAARYEVAWQDESDYLFAYIYGDYPIDEIVKMITNHTTVSTEKLYTATR